MSKTLQFKITLIDSKPAIWRTFQVEDSYRLDRFHQVIQILMGWQNSHLHMYMIEGRSIGMLLNDGFDLPDMEDETKLYIKDLSLEKGDKFGYIYDFGDDWGHNLDVLKVTEAESPLPVCLDGKRACPPEDCGGIYSYTDLLKVIKNPAHPNYDHWIGWIGENFDPNFFDLADVNHELTRFGQWHKKYPRKRSTPWHRIG